MNDEYYYELARKIVNNAFRDKKDLVGQPYIKHLIYVADNVNLGVYTKQVSTAALLHDILEDCPEWTDGALNAIFPPTIVNAVVLLTRKPDQDYFDYIKCIAENSLAKEIKIWDLRHNLDITRYTELDDAAVRRLNKYLKAYHILINK